MPTRFLRSDTPSTGQPTALAQDAADFLDALKIKKAPIVGHDWGAGIGYVFAALWPERTERLVAMSSPYLDWMIFVRSNVVAGNIWNGSESHPYQSVTTGRVAA